MHVFQTSRRLNSDQDGWRDMKSIFMKLTVEERRFPHPKPGVLGEPGLERHSFVFSLREDLLPS